MSDDVIETKFLNAIDIKIDCTYRGPLKTDYEI